MSHLAPLVQWIGIDYNLHGTNVESSCFKVTLLKLELHVFICPNIDECLVLSSLLWIGEDFALP